MYPLMVGILFFLSFSNSKYVFYAASLIFLSFYTITYGYGYDWVNYYRIFNNIDYYDVMPFEPGYYYLMRFFHFYGFNFGALTAAVNCFVGVSVVIYCKKKENKTLLLFCLFSFMGFFMFMEQIRQGLAIAVLLYFLDDLKNKNYKKFYIGVLLAMCFHASSFTALFFPLLNRKISKAKLISFFVISLIVVYGAVIMINYPQYIFIPYLKNKVLSYGGMSGSLDNTLFNKSSLIYLLLLVPALISRKIEGYKDEAGKAIISVFLIFETKLAFFLLRFQYYFFILYVDSIDRFLSTRKKTGWLRVFLSLIVLIISYMPYRYDIYNDSIDNPVTIFSSRQEIENKIIKRCSDLYRHGGDDSSIVTCRYL